MNHGRSTMRAGAGLTGRIVTEADIIIFAAITGDWRSLNADVEFAKKSQFGERIARGMLVFSLASGLFPRYGIYDVVQLDSGHFRRRVSFHFKFETCPSSFLCHCEPLRFLSF